MFSRLKLNQSEIPINMIEVNQEQPRKTFQEQELQDLSNSIREFGVIQPIIVKRVGGKYQLIAGERRLRAATMVGLEKIPAMIREVDDRDSALIALVENVQRENLNYIEEAMAYKTIMEEYGLTQADIAKRIGKQQSTISNKIRLLALPEELRTALTENQLTERHARALLKVKDNVQRKQLLQKIISHNLNVKQSEKLINEFVEKTDEERRKSEKLKYIHYKIYVNTIKKAFNVIQEVEENAQYFQEDKGDYLEVRIIIPKKVG